MNTAGAVPVVLGDLLWRKCTRCGHGWHERLPPADAIHLPIGNHL